MKKIQKSNKKTHKTKIIILLTCILMLFLTGYSIGKQATKTTVLTEGEIAKPIFIVDNNPEIEITAKQKEGYYYFKVRNYELEEMSQVDMQYYIEIIGDIDEAIICTLYRGEEQIALQDRKTQTQKLTRNQKEEHSYCLKVEYDKEKNTSLSDIMQELQIKVHAEQGKHWEG